MRRFGVVKPLIANADGTIIAGHQRFEQMKALGRKFAPVYLVDGLTLTDEARFNQMHNLTDDTPGLWATVPPGRRTGRFEEVSPSAITGSFRGPDAITRATIGDLICRYGNWGSAVALSNGEVIHGINYALTCAIIGIPCRVYRVPDAARKWLGRPYGSFSFARLAGETWRQGVCQRPRLSRGKKRRCFSRLYEAHVLPALKKSERVLDFGAGHADYAKMLRRQGYRVSWIEFFPDDDIGGIAIDFKAARFWCRQALEDWAQHGPFDVVVCDSVLNSVDGIQAERDVMTVVNALCRPGGRIHISGRRKERLASLSRGTLQSNTDLRFGMGALDANGMMATYRGDLDASETAWTFQKFHSKAEAVALAEDFIGPVERFTHSSTSWQITARKTLFLPPVGIEAALRREFDLPLPGGKRFGQANAAVMAWQEAACGLHKRAS